MFYKEISWLAAEGISTGWDIGGGVRQYRPLDSIARDAMAAFLYRKAGSPAYTPPASSPFTDVATGAAFYKEITWLSSQGISTGWDMGGGKREYRPLSPIARDAMAAFLFRFAKPAGFTAPTQSPFIDVPTGTAFYREITWLASSGISTGWDVGGGAREYRPLNGIARDAMGAFLYRYASEKVPANPSNPAAGTVTVAPDVEVLDAAQLDTALVSGSALTLPSNEAVDINANDVLVAGVTPGTPEGLLARVVQVSRDPGGSTVVSLKPATITEAIVSTSGLLEVAGTPVSSSFTPEPDVTVTPDASASSRLAQPEALTTADIFSESFSVNRTIKSEVETDELAGSGSLKIESAIKASAKAKMTLETGFLQLKEASVVITPTFTAKHSVSVAGTLEGTASAKLGVLRALIYFPTAIPIVVTAEAEIAANLSAAGTAEISIVTAHTVSYDVGFKYREGSLSLVNTKPQVTGVENGVQATASLTARLALDFDADIRFYGIAGITFGAGPYASAPIAVVASGGTLTWSCPIEVGFEARLGVVAGIEVMGFKLERSDGVSAQWKLLEVNPCEGKPVTAPGPSVPVTAPDLKNVKSIVGGAYDRTSYALTADGAVWAWGLNGWGALGNGTEIDNPTPEPIPGLANVVEIAAGNASGYALKNDGTVWAWGINVLGELGVPGLNHSLRPVQLPGLTNVASIAAAHRSAYAIKNDGTLWAWGGNAWGSLGDGTTIDRPSPVQIPKMTGIKAIAPTTDQTVALKGDGTVWSWGEAPNSQSPEPVHLTPVQNQSVTGVQQIAAAHFTTYALRTDGRVLAWGYNTQGGLGIGDNVSRPGPVEVTGLTGVSAISAGGRSAYALKTDGSLWSWGWNYQGQLGDGTTVDRWVPTRVGILTNVLSVSARETGAYAITRDGLGWAWGSNDNGVIGDGTTQQRNLPVRVGVAVP
ncbi:MAG: Ig family protein [Pseudarthrobacter sp.]|nr:Ig family protein [Pseudarthrobacter sp.]